MMRELKAIIIIAIGIIVMIALAYTNPATFFIGQIVIQVLMLLAAVSVTMGLLSTKEETSSEGSE